MDHNSPSSCASSVGSCRSIVRSLSFTRHHSFSDAMTSADARDVLDSDFYTNATSRFSVAQQVLDDLFPLNRSKQMIPKPNKMPENNRVQYHFPVDIPLMPIRKRALSPVTTKKPPSKRVQLKHTAEDTLFGTFNIGLPVTMVFDPSKMSHLMNGTEHEDTPPPSPRIGQEDTSTTPSKSERASESDESPSSSPRPEPKSDNALNITFSTTCHDLNISGPDDLCHGNLKMTRPLTCTFDKPPTERPRIDDSKPVPSPSDYSFDSPSEVERDIPQMVRNRSGVLRFLMPRVSSKRSASMEASQQDAPMYQHKRSSLPSLREHRMDSTTTREERATLPPHNDRPNTRPRVLRVRNLFSALRQSRRSSYPVPDRADRRGTNFTLRTKLTRSRMSSSPTSSQDGGSGSLNNLHSASVPLEIPPLPTLVKPTRGEPPRESPFPRATTSPPRAPYERPQRRIPLADRTEVNDWSGMMLPRSASSAAFYTPRPHDWSSPLSRSSSGTTMRTISMPKPPDTIPRRRTDMSRLSTPLTSSATLHLSHDSYNVNRKLGVDTRKVRMPGSGKETIVSELPVESARTERRRRKRTFAPRHHVALLLGI